MLKYNDIEQITVHYVSGKALRMNDGVYKVGFSDGVAVIVNLVTPNRVNLISLTAVTTIGLKGKDGTNINIAGDDQNGLREEEE